MTHVNTFVTGDRVVIGEGTTRDELQARRAWLASDRAVDLTAMR